MRLFSRTLQIIKDNQKKVKEGGINCIPLHYPRFSSELTGIEQKNYYQVTASTKVGKTQVTDDIFMYNTVKFAYNNQDKVRLKIFYFTLEMSQEQKMMQVMSHLLWETSQGQVRATPKDLRSVNSNIPISDDIIKVLESEEYQKYFEFFENSVEFIDSIKHPYGIYRFMRDYAKAHGKQHTKVIPIVNNSTGEVTEQEVDDWYEPYDPDEYVLVIVDHMALLSPENGKTVRDAMIKLSSDYFVTLRNKYRYIPVAVVQQAMSQEGNDNFKLGKLKPTLDGYGDAKVIARDADVILGLFSPYRHAIPEYEGYNIKLFKDNIRFLELIAGREGGGGNVCPLFFDGGTNFFKELPLPKDTEGISRVSKLLERVRSRDIGMMAYLTRKKSILLRRKVC